MNTTSLTIMSTYTTVEVGLFQNNNTLEKIIIDNKNASKALIATIAQLLTNNKKKLNDLSYITVNQGPGPFTTLRTIISSLNGLAFATKIPLIGLDAISVLLDEYHNNNNQYTVTLLNAFSGDVYYGIRYNNQDNSGYKNAIIFLEEFAKASKKASVFFIGAGVKLYENEIKKNFGERAIIPNPLPKHCSLEALAQIGLQKWKNKENLSQELHPLYLKIHSALKNLQ